MHLIFKRLGAEDIEQLGAVADDIFDHPIDVRFARDFLADPRNILIVALADDRVIAQLVAIVHRHLDAPPDLFVENLGVAASWRRRGVARRLIAMAFEEGAKQGARTAWVATEEDNDAANALYAATGAAAGRFVMFSYQSLSGIAEKDAP